MVLVLAALSVLEGQTPVEPPSPAQLAVQYTREKEFVEQQLDDGRHLRFGTADKGPVHVWRPRFYSSGSAPTVVYLHGFYTDADGAMLEHQLSAQFRDANRNALFVVPETRSGKNDPYLWKDLEQLLTTVERRAKLKRPSGPIVIVAHSGGYKLTAEWLKHPQVKKVILVDGLYGNVDDFKKWIDEPNTPGRQLVMVGYDTQQQSDWLVKKSSGAVRLDEVPYLYDDVAVSTRAARIVYFQSERFDHMGLVTTGRLIPWLLHVFRE